MNLQNHRVGKSIYNLELNKDKLVVEKDGKIFIEGERGILIRGIRLSLKEMEMEIIKDTNKIEHLVLFNLPFNIPVKIKFKDETFVKFTNEQGKLKVCL